MKTMKSMKQVMTLLLIVLWCTISSIGLAADPINIDDDLKEIEARFNAELEKMRLQFRKELEQAQVGPRDELLRARNRIRDLELENERLRGQITAANATIASMKNEAVAVSDAQETTSSARGYLGISIVEIDADQANQLEVSASESVLVESVEAGSTASEMGLKPGDAIFVIEGQGASYDALVSILTVKKAGESVTAAWARPGADGVVKVRGRGILKGTSASGNDQQVSEASEATPVETQNTVAVQTGITFGVSVVQEESFGLRVTSVEAGSNADVAGIKVGDIVLGFGDAKVRTIEGLRDVLSSTVVGSQGRIMFSRNGESWWSEIRFGGGDVAMLLLDGPKKSNPAGGQTGEVAADRGFLGIVPVERGESVVVSEVITGSCADQMGLRQGDLLVSVAGRMVTSIDVLRQALAKRTVGESIEIRFARGGVANSVQGVLGKYPVTGGQSSISDPELDSARPVASSARMAAVGRLNSGGNGKLGIVVAWDADGAYIETILPGSGAGAAGALIGDRIIRVDEVAIGSLEQIGEVLSHKIAGSPVSMEVLRGNEPMTLIAHRNELPSAEPLPAGITAASQAPPVLGIEVEENAIGILVTEIHDGSLASEAGLQQGDWIIRVCEMEVRSIEDMQDSLQYSGLLEIHVTIRRDLDILQYTIPLQQR